MRPRNPTPVSRGYRMKLQTSVHPRSHKTVTDMAAAFGCPQSLVVDLALGVLEIVLSRPEGEVMLTPAEYVERYLQQEMQGMTAQVQTFICEQGPEGESVFDCAVRHGFDAETYRVAGGIMGAPADGEAVVGYVKARPNDAAYPIVRRAMSAN